MLAVPAVQSDDIGLAAQHAAERGRPSERLGPVGREALRVVRPEAVSERVADDLVGHDAHVPALCESQQARFAAGGFVDRRHDRSMPAGRSMRWARATMIPSGPRTYAMRQMCSYWPMPPTRP